MANVTNTLIANITTTEDTTQNVVINRSTGNPAIDSTSAILNEYLTLTGITSVGLPLGKALQLYIRNIDSANTITITWTPTGGASAAIITLAPTDQIIFWQKQGVATSGISALSIAASAYPTLCEIFLGS